MHDSVQAFIRSALTAEDVKDRTVCEAGARDVNGTVRPYIESLGPASYLATDLHPGPGVDEVCDAAALYYLGSFDVIISTEMLEHAENWKPVFLGLVKAMPPWGLLVLTTRGPGFGYHPHPGDYWRFTVQAMGEILAAAGLKADRLEADPEASGVFVKAVKPPGWFLPADWLTRWDAAGVLPVDGAP